MANRAISASTCARVSRKPFWSRPGSPRTALNHDISTYGQGFSNIISSSVTGAICALVLTMSSPSRSAADLIVFAGDGTARTSGWTFHGQRPLWAGLELPEAGATQRSTRSEPGKPTKARAEILSLIAVTAHRHSTHHALKTLGMTPTEWQRLFRALVEA